MNSATDGEMVSPRSLEDNRWIKRVSKNLGRNNTNGTVYPHPSFSTSRRSLFQKPFSVRSASEANLTWGRRRFEVSRSRDPPWLYRDVRTYMAATPSCPYPNSPSRRSLHALKVLARDREVGKVESRSLRPDFSRRVERARRLGTWARS